MSTISYGVSQAVAPAVPDRSPAPLWILPSGRVAMDAGPGAGGSLPSGTDRSGTITTANTAQQLAPANASRLSLKGQNVSTGNLGINEVGGTAAIGSAGTYTVAPGAAFSVSTNRAISIVGPTAGQAFSATET